MKLLLFVMAVTLGMATVRIATINARGGYQTFEAVVRAITSFASMLMCLALIVWGFAALAWYWPVATFVAASIIVGMAIGRDNWPAFYVIQPLIALGTIGIGLVLWIAYWPF